MNANSIKNWLKFCLYNWKIEKHKPKQLETITICFEFCFLENNYCCVKQQRKAEDEKLCEKFDCESGMNHNF